MLSFRSTQTMTWFEPSHLLPIPVPPVVFISLRSPFSWHLEDDGDVAFPIASILRSKLDPTIRASPLHRPLPNAGIRSPLQPKSSAIDLVFPAFILDSVASQLGHYHNKASSAITRTDHHNNPRFLDNPRLSQNDHCCHRHNPT